LIMEDTSFEEFVDLSKKGTFIPVCKEVMADLLTPVSAFLKIAEHSDYAFLFESVEGGERAARYSFLGKDPFMLLRSSKGRTIVQRGTEAKESERPFLETLREVMGRYHAPLVPGFPRFTGGAVGFLGYEASSWFEPSLERAWQQSKEISNRNDDDAGFMLFDTVLAFDHVKHRILIIASSQIEEGVDLKSLYDFAQSKIQFLERELEKMLSERVVVASGPLSLCSNITKEVFEKKVRQAQDYIRDGDIYQVVLSQRFEAEINVDPFAVYRALRYVNPSPYMYFIRLGKLTIVGSSPEMLVRVEGRNVETHPIAGTRPRGRTNDEDIKLANELSNNEKEMAEHVMLVDLGRNDLGRVCDFGSVRVPQYMSLERYSHVMHLVSRVEGTLSVDHDRLDALAACFPAGTVSGAPKIRAMEIVAELESMARGTYAGAVGHIDFSGNLDFCITIRTIAIRDGRAYVQAGAGIVADSNPATEYQETCDKASALIRSLEMAQHGKGPKGFGVS
jgi:anthranilate synthase component 1